MCSAQTWEDLAAVTTGSLDSQVCIAGGGPAGMMLGLLLARAGIDVIVVEKHADFLRDFRGDTIHPSTLDLLAQLDLLAELDSISHTDVTSLDAVLLGVRTHPVDFGRLRHGARRLVMMPQWDLLDLLSKAALARPNFTLLMESEATGLMGAEGRTTGIQVRTPTGICTIGAGLTVIAEGRSSGLRELADLPLRDYGAPIDVLWFRLPRPRHNPPDTIIYITEHQVMVTIPRPGYYQAALLVAKGGFDQIREQGLPAFRATVADTVPFLAETVDAVEDWDDVKLLTVQINRLTRWHRPGLLAIGDAAHAMSPAFGVGINYAIQDAVATANLLVEPLRTGTVHDHHLAAVQRRREPPVARMQALQRGVHRLVARPGGGRRLPPAALLRVLSAATGPITRPVATRVIGRGFRPEVIDVDVLRARR